jgi:2-iminobutanoate/2-iminopropanoate deaminase
MQRTIVRSTHAPAAIGPYSQAISVPLGDGKKMIFCSGQIALDPETGAVVEGDIEAETRQVLANLHAVLSAAGATFADIVKTTIYLASMDDFARVNAIYGERFATEPPARATVAVAGLPRKVRVEIDAIAVV